MAEREEGSADAFAVAQLLAERQRLLEEGGCVLVLAVEDGQPAQVGERARKAGAVAQLALEAEVLFE